MIDQTIEIDFDDLTMESPHEVTRVIRFWEDAGMYNVDEETEGDFTIYLDYAGVNCRMIRVVYESGYQFIFHIYRPTNDAVEAIRQFDEFLRAHLDRANIRALNNFPTKG